MLPEIASALQKELKILSSFHILLLFEVEVVVGDVNLIMQNK